MTVIFMEEGAESSDFSTQTAQQMGLLSGDDNVQYQFIQDGENYTTQVYEAGQESVLTTSTDSLLTGMDVTQQQITDQTQFAVSDTDTYYITETGEIVKIEGSLLDYGEGQQGFIQSNQAFETQTIMSADASLVTRIPTVVSESTVVTSQTTIPDSSNISGVFEDQTVLPDTQTVLPDTTVHTGAQDNFEFTAVKVPAVQIQTASTFTSTGGKSLLSTGIKQPPMAFTNTVVQNPTGATRTVQVQRPGQQSTSYPKQSPIQSGGGFTSYINPTHLTQKIKTQPITYQIHSKPIQNTVTVKPKEVTIQTAYKPTTYQQSVQPSSVQTILSSPVITSNKSVNTQTKYSAKVSSTTLQPAVIKKIAVPPSQQIGTPAINRLVKVPAKQNKLNQISVTQQRDREVKHASDMLSNVIHAVDFNLPGAKSIPAASPILKPAVVSKATTSMASVPFSTSAVRNSGPVTTSVSDLDMLSMVTQALNSGSLDQLTGSLDITNMARTTVQQTVTSHLETPLLNHMGKDTARMADTSTMDMDDLDSSLAMDTHQDVPSPTAISTTFKHTEQTVSGAHANGADVEPPALPDSTGSEQASPSKTDVNDKVTASETASAIKPVTASSTVEKPKMKSIDVPDSDVTIELYADGTLVTKDRAGTNYSKSISKQCCVLLLRRTNVLPT
ncbi:streptococcal hemagglutinin-like isoform X1 [Dreissena polymorpha]|nr:streptococcal hemagglutinin-like isoform X1 [Dreissena polymorpha]